MTSYVGGALTHNSSPIKFNKCDCSAMTISYPDAPNYLAVYTIDN